MTKVGAPSGATIQPEGEVKLTMAHLAVLIADLGFGDAGKGSIVDYLARQAKSAMVVRYNGGPQAAHNVVTPDGKHHTFAQFGSGCFVPNVRTHLGPGMLINPFNAFEEARHLQSLGINDIWLRTTFNADAMVITPFHVAVNRLRELARGDARHGSCGQGIGETRAFDIAHPFTSIHMRDLANPGQLRFLLRLMQGHLSADVRHLFRALGPSEEVTAAENLLLDPDVVERIANGYGQFLQVARVIGTPEFARLSEGFEHLIFEGAQGVLLDEKYGFHPHTTWSDITYRHAHDLLEAIGFDGEIRRQGLLRGYATRHGAGPFVTEDAGLSETIQDYHNDNNQWQRAFRVGFPDLVMTRYAIDVVGGVDELVVTNLDRMVETDQPWKVANRYHVSEPNNLDAIFSIDDTGAVVGIKHKAEKDLVRQELITGTLMACTPVYQELKTASGNGKLVTEDDVRDYLSLLEAELHAPITLTSHGVTASDKRVPPR